MSEPANFEFSDSDPDFVQGSCYGLPSDTRETLVEKNRRANAPALLAAIKALTDREFEFLCGILLECMKADKAFVSKSAGDQGVDFFGKVDFREFVRNTSTLGPVTPVLSVWIVGQAKRYEKTIVSTSAIRELVGSIELAKSRIYADNGDALKELSVRICEPIFYLLVTSGAFTSGSNVLMENAGVIGIDGQRLAAFLADHGIGIVGGKFDVHELTRAISRFEAAQTLRHAAVNQAPTA